MAPIISLLPPPGRSVLNTPGSLSTNPPDLFLYASSVRVAVFIHEQHCSIENEIDSDDARSWHWICFASRNERDVVASKEGLKEHTERESEEEEKIPVGTVRLVPVGSHSIESSAEPNVEGPSHDPTMMWNGREPYVKIGRLATISTYRGMGLGRILMNEALQWAASNRDILSKGPDKESNGWEGLVLVHAQKDVENFYAKIGFVRDEELGIWREEGIQHVGMWKRV